MRSTRAASAVLLALAAPAHGLDEQSWGFVVASKQEVLLSYGVPESDIITINFFCRPAAKRIEIATTVVPAKPRKGQPLKTTLTNGSVTAAYGGKIGRDDHGFHFAVTTPAEPKVMDVLRSGTTLIIGIAGKQHRVPLRGIAKPLAQFEAACFGKR
jgi:hypothetical protein